MDADAAATTNIKILSNDFRIEFHLIENSYMSYISYSKWIDRNGDRSKRKWQKIPPIRNRCLCMSQAATAYCLFIFLVNASHHYACVSRRNEVVCVWFGLFTIFLCLPLNKINWLKMCSGQHKMSHFHVTRTHSRTHSHVTCHPFILT